jgi:quinol-cytochrome oxidoreductase complex cytochrome b subunit
MRARSSRDDPIRTRLLVFLIVAVGVLIVVLLVNPTEEGDPLMRADPPAPLLEITRVTLDSYSDLIRLLAGSFAVVSFLVGFQSKRGVRVPASAWTQLAAGVLLLACALLVTLLGRERILTMIARDAVSLSADSLLYMRWFSYVCFTVAALLVSAFAAAAANASLSEPSARPPEEDQLT